MKRKDFILALLVVIVWGANFTVIKLGLGGVPPMLLVALRFSLVAFPAVFFIKKPKIDLIDLIITSLDFKHIVAGCNKNNIQEIE